MKVVLVMYCKDCIYAQIAHNSRNDIIFVSVILYCQKNTNFMYLFFRSEARILHQPFELLKYVRHLNPSPLRGTLGVKENRRMLPPLELRRRVTMRKVLQIMNLRILLSLWVLY